MMIGGVSHHNVVVVVVVVEVMQEGNCYLYPGDGLELEDWWRFLSYVRP